MHYVDGDSATVGIEKRLLSGRHYMIGALPDDVPAEVKSLSARYSYTKILKKSMQRPNKQIGRVELVLTDDAAKDPGVQYIVRGMMVLKYRPDAD